MLVQSTSTRLLVPSDALRFAGRKPLRRTIVITLVAATFCIYVHYDRSTSAASTPVPDGGSRTTDELHRRTFQTPRNVAAVEVYKQRLIDATFVVSNETLTTRLKDAASQTVDEQNRHHIHTQTFQTPQNVTVVEVANPFRALAVVSNGTLTRRLQDFNAAVDRLRSDVLRELAADNSLRASGSNTMQWNNDRMFVDPLHVIVVNEDDYLEKLTSKFPLVRVLILPWLNTTQNGTWSSLSDVHNLLIQEYHPWIASNPLCRWLTKSSMVGPTYSALVGQRGCTSFGNGNRPPPEVGVRVSLSPVHFHARTMHHDRYFPNGGRSFPDEFYRSPPPFVVVLAVVRDALVTRIGNVIGRGRVDAENPAVTKNVKLARYFCKIEADTSTTVPAAMETAPAYDEVFAAGMLAGTAFYHRLIEQIPRVAPYVDFLSRNPSVFIHIWSVEDTISVRLLEALGITDAGRRVVSGSIRAKVAYVPRFAECLWARPVDVQIASSRFRDHVRRHNFRSTEPRRRDRLVMIRRTRSTRAIERRADVERAVSRAAADYGLRYTLFGDDPSPSLNETMKLFNEAVMVVGPHGAGLANLVFCDPGTFVVEIVCQAPKTRLCYMHLSQSLGLRWHGVPVKSGCPQQLHVHTADVNSAVRLQLNAWKSENQGHPSIQQLTSTFLVGNVTTF